MAVTITSTADKEVTVILADAQAIGDNEGEGDGERTKFLPSFGQDPEFLRFIDQCKLTASI